MSIVKSAESGTPSSGPEKNSASWHVILFLLSRSPLTEEEDILVEESIKYYKYLKEPKNKWRLAKIFPLIAKYGLIIEGLNSNLKKESEKYPCDHETLMDIF